jgi:hypothetical protein
MKSRQRQVKYQLLKKQLVGSLTGLMRINQPANRLW